MIRTDSEKEMILGLVGENPSTYSKSRILWNFCFEKFGIDAEYISWDVSKGEFEEKFDELLSNKKIVGFNITNPYKVDAMHLVEQSGIVDKGAEVAGGINTYVASNSTGYSTDGYGALKSITKEGFAIDGKNVLVLGCGGAAKSIVVEALMEGGIVTVANRTYQTALNMKEDVHKYLKKDIKAIHLYDSTNNHKSDEVLEAIELADIIINTVDFEKRFGHELFTKKHLMHSKKDCVLMDAVYGHTSYLNNYFEELGRNVVSGENMLVYQAVKGFELLFPDYDGELVEKYMMFAIDQLNFDTTNEEIKKAALLYD